MVHSIKELKGYSLHATDGQIGKVHDFYFDDALWLVRYLIADTGNWLPGRKVLISPVAIDQLNWNEKTFSVSLTCKQLENSPDIDLDKPVSRQQEEALFNYYDWPFYWPVDPYTFPGAPNSSPEMMETLLENLKQRPGETEVYDPQLRSAREVIGYHIQAKDGEIGHLEDFLLGDEDWLIHQLVVDTRNWLPGKKIMLSPHWILNFDWIESKAHVELTRQVIKNSPGFDYAVLPLSEEKIKEI